MTDVSDLPPDDQQAIGKTLPTLLASFRNRDTEALHAVYSDDADWVNAFGTVKRGREAIVGYLTGSFADDNFNRGHPEGPPEPSFPGVDTRGRSGVCTPADQRSGGGRRRHA
jgi:hypothetical protein